MDPKLMQEIAFKELQRMFKYAKELRLTKVGFLREIQGIGYSQALHQEVWIPIIPLE